MKRLTLTLVVAISTGVLAGAAVQAQRYARGEARSSPLRVRVQYGSASWYGGAFHGRRTAYGERFDRSKMTLASRSLPYNTRVRVTCLRTGKSCVARVTDYGPNGSCRRRIADLSEAAASAIGLRSAGVGKVRIEPLGWKPVEKMARAETAGVDLARVVTRRYVPAGRRKTVVVKTRRSHPRVHPRRRKVVVHTRHRHRVRRVSEWSVPLGFPGDSPNLAAPGVLFRSPA